MKQSIFPITFDKKAFKKCIPLYIIILPGIIYFIIFKYIPMFGLVIAFKDYNIMEGIFNSPWVGFSNFVSFFESIYFWRVLRNTFLISFFTIIVGFPIPIIFALLLNEVRHRKFKKIVQTTSYLPHFISSVIIVGMTLAFLSPSTGLVNNILTSVFNIEPIYFMSKPEYFRTIYVLMDVWKTFGWNAIIYIAALSSIDPTFYEAAHMDGAKRSQVIFQITIPSIMPTIIIMLILRLGVILNVSFENVLLLYNPMVYETADIIATYVYRRGLLGEGGLPDYSFSTAVGLFQSVINFIFLIASNKISRHVSEESLW